MPQYNLSDNEWHTLCFYYQILLQMCLLRGGRFEMTGFLITYNPLESLLSIMTGSREQIRTREAYRFN